MKNKSSEENVAGIKCNERNLANLLTSSSHNNLFFDLPRHPIPATFKFFEKLIFLLFYPKKFQFLSKSNYL